MYGCMMQDFATERRAEQIVLDVGKVGTHISTDRTAASCLLVDSPYRPACEKNTTVKARVHQLVRLLLLAIACETSVAHLWVLNRYILAYARMCKTFTLSCKYISIQQCCSTKALIVSTAALIMPVRMHAGSV